MESAAHTRDLRGSRHDDRTGAGRLRVRVQEAPRRIGGAGEKCWAGREGKRLHAARADGEDASAKTEAVPIGVIATING
jgi:hypothetical protein